MNLTTSMRVQPLRVTVLEHVGGCLLMPGRGGAALRMGLFGQNLTVDFRIDLPVTCRSRVRISGANVQRTFAT